MIAASLVHDGDGAGDVGVEGGLLGVHRRLRGVIDDATTQALSDQEAKQLPMHFASTATPDRP